MTKLNKLLAEKAKYEANDDNFTLQQAELDSISREILCLLDTKAGELTEEEKSAENWAKQQLETIN